MMGPMTKHIRALSIVSSLFLTAFAAPGVKPDLDARDIEIVVHISNDEMMAPVGCDDEYCIQDMCWAEM